jgi:hypothetical protein
MAVLMPMIFPWELSSGPPELPGFSGAFFSHVFCRFNIRKKIKVVVEIARANGIKAFLFRFLEFFFELTYPT